MVGRKFDKIYIRGLEVFGKHGVLQEENRLGQKFIINAILFTDTRKAGLNDNLINTTHYGEVSHFMTNFMVEHTFRLIETVAEQMARAVLMQFQMVERITLEIRKPWAPIGLPLESVSVEITRGWHQAFIAIGSNMGDKEAFVKRGIDALRELEDCVVEQVSEMIETKPYGVTDQPDFLNGMILVKTLLTPYELLAELMRIEQESGRERIVHWGPRTLDLDIIFYDDAVIDTKDLTIPHPDMANRRFVLEPLAQVAPHFRHPLLHKTVRQMLEEI